jgi:DNA polymerase family A
MKVAVFDIESGAAEELHSFGPGFVRLCGWTILDTDTNVRGEIHISADPRPMLKALAAADAVTGHNIIDFDLIALAKYHGLDYEAMARKSYDTMIVERHVNPVAAKGAQPRGYYGLDATAERYGAAGKSTVDFEGKRDIVRRVKGDAAANRMKPGKNEDATYSVLKVLADLYGGYHLIPQDDPDYVAYLRLDVEASAALFRKMLVITSGLSAGDQRYIRREHAVQASMGRTTLEGFRVDVDETMARWSAGQQRLEEGKQELHERHGMPLEGRYPHRSNAGKAAFRSALLATGISEDALDANWPTGKDGSLLTGKEVLNSMLEVFDRTKPDAAQLCRIILAMNGERTVYGTILDHTVEGRVHPTIRPEQSSGRWSMKDPGLTVMGKRGGKGKERCVLLADEGEVLVAIDADQVDARGIAGLSQDPEYMKLFMPGVDLHSEVALRVFGRDECRAEMARNNGRCDCEYRDRAKVFGHGWNYGMGPNSMARQHGVDINVARKFDQGMQEAFPVLCEWKETVRAQAGALGFDEVAPANDTYRILHTGYGRPVRVERNRAYTQACAQLGQGTTRDIMAEAILKLPAATRRRIKAVIHDEIVLSIPAADAQATAQGIADSMAFDFRGVAITFGCSTVGPNWGSCYGY